MANVRKYTEQIASAKKGKDVRAAIVSAINEVSDENNTYNQTFIYRISCNYKIV